MMKKRLLLSIFVACLFVTFALGLSACKKSADEVPAELTVLRVRGIMQYVHTVARIYGTITTIMRNTMKVNIIP